MPLWGRKKSGGERVRQHGAEARAIPGWLATDPFSGVAGLLNRWAVPVLWEALDEKVTPQLVEDAFESVKLRGAKLELKALGQVGWLFLSALRTVYRKTLTQDAEIRKLWDEVAALQERQLLMKETIESAVTQGDQIEARCTALAVRVAKQKSRQKPKIPSAVQVRALVRKENGDPYTWDGTVSDNDDDWYWEDEMEVCVAELGGVESGEGNVVTAHAMLGQRLRGAQGQQAFSLMDWLMEGVKQLCPTAIDVEESWGPWHTISEANEQLREMRMQNAVYSQQFLGPDVEPVTAGIRARLIKNAPSHMKGALLALLGPAQGRPVGDVVLLMAQLEGLERQKSSRAVVQDNKHKGGESTIKVTRRQMWIDLLNAGVKKEEIDGKSTPYLLNKWKALQLRQKEKEAFDEKQPLAAPMEESEKDKTESGKSRKVPVSTLYPDLSSNDWEVPDPLL
ncbi:hypothetical protein NDU88_002189 [Pleurodeles waltl]|uniref:Gag polyprotein n=1 Tax=Pleurodeles waltl TaxID=8319 RepID=A0AAV7RAN1_PLEWA|nr:hypothetical protein NDU88_002189 [Pleurodeles waltl]